MRPFVRVKLLKTPTSIPNSQEDGRRPEAARPQGEAGKDLPSLRPRLHRSRDSGQARLQGEDRPQVDRPLQQVRRDRPGGGTASTQRTNPRRKTSKTLQISRFGGRDRAGWNERIGTGNRVGCVKPSRGFESHPLRSPRLSLVLSGQGRSSASVVDAPAAWICELEDHGVGPCLPDLKDAATKTL